MKPSETKSKNMGQKKAAVTWCSVKNVFLKFWNFEIFAKSTGKHLCQSLFYRTLLMAASEISYCWSRSDIDAEHTQNLQKNTGKLLLPSLFLHKIADLAYRWKRQKKAPIQMLSCEFTESSKSTFFTEEQWAAASEE